MDFSSNYHIRKDKLQNLQVPTITETKENLGEKLADIFIKSCPESLQAEMSIAQKLNGPGQDLWTSPSDLLINKLVLKPPLTNKHIKALTHEGILEIGYQVELKKKMLEEEELKKALYEQEVWLRFIAAKEREKAVMDAVAREQELFRLKLIQLNEEFEQLVQNLLSRVEEKLRETYEEMLAVETEKILREQEAIWTKKIEEAVEETVNTLTSKFLKELELQEKEIVAVFEAKMDAEREMYAKSLEAERDAYCELVKQLKHNIYCNNIANLMYMLCTERRKCYLEQTELVNKYERKILILENAKDQMKFDLDEMKADCDKMLVKIQIREECMTKVLEQFQKFINFALRAVPAQAEFLLDMNKMMTFELTQAIARLDHVHPIKQLMPWRSTEQVDDKVLMSAEMDDLADKYHDCLNEEDPPQNDDDENANVYSMKYRKKLYVREDFRNMVSNGEEINQTNMIWTKDIENLVNLLKETAIDDSIESLNKDVKSQVSNVHFNANPNLQNNGSFGIGILAAQDSMELQKSGRSHSVSSDLYIKKPSCAILASPDSLTIIKNIDRAQSKHTDDGSKELIVKHFSCDTLTLSVSRKNRDSNRASFESPCETFSEETLKLACKKKNKLCEEVYKKFKDKSTSTGQLHEHEVLTETDKRESSQELHCSRKKKRRLSLLVLHKDSLEIARSNMHLEENRFRDIVRAGPLYKSGVCLLDMPIADIVQGIDFEPVAKVYKDNNVQTNKCANVAQKPPSISEEAVEKPVERDHFLDKPGVAKILGKQGREHLETNQEFTVHRIHSIVDMLKKDDSLIRMFTRCNQ